jgi:hypothetical protein
VITSLQLTLPCRKAQEEFLTIVMMYSMCTYLQVDVRGSWSIID